MKRNILVLYTTVASSFVSPCYAALTYTKSEDASETVIRMTVTPAAEPIPALRHRLVARDVDLKPGNAAPYYYRAMLDLTPAMERIRKEFGDDYDNWYISSADGTPLDKLPLDKVRKADSKANGIVPNYLRDAMQH